jgi:hypothetical protein
LDYSEFKCKWIEPASLWNIADEARNKYWPESKLPVNTEEMELYVKLAETGRFGGYGVGSYKEKHIDITYYPCLSFEARFWINERCIFL